MIDLPSKPRGSKLLSTVLRTLMSDDRSRPLVDSSFTYPTVTSKMLDPTEEETAMSPKPFLATITDVIKSGMDVPAARNVRPIT